MENPSPDELTHMIEAIFVRADKLLADNDLDPPGNVTGFTELLRHVFGTDENGMKIFATMDDELLTVLYQLYEDRRKNSTK